MRHAASFAGMIVPDTDSLSTYTDASCPTEHFIEAVPRVSFERCVGSRSSRKTHLLVLCESRYIDLGQCHSPDEPEWRSLSTWPPRRNSGDWRLSKEGTDLPRFTIDVTHMGRIPDGFEKRLAKEDMIQ